MLTAEKLNRLNELAKKKKLGTITDEELKEIIKAALSEKPDGHHFREKVKEDDTESLCMSQIGG